MRLLKNMAFAGLMTLGAFSAVTYTSCNKDECKDVECQNGGTCSGGNCVCPSGYEGTSCETLSIVKFAKTWTASDQTGSTNLVYSVVIVPGSAVGTAIIANEFSDELFFNSIDATVDKNVITIPDQKPDVNGDYRVEGEGVYQANGSIVWNYTITRISTNELQIYTGVWN
ncbi:MAG: hypothetical protein EOP49_29790 [Sphingobacteriales bacterium]|nr:MAG: hypothetical protein EOP49_29790 [Sphingobacteriales bacterium]